jgi:hypothetical protein
VTRSKKVAHVLTDGLTVTDEHAGSIRGVGWSLVRYEPGSDSLPICKSRDRYADDQHCHAPLRGLALRRPRTAIRQMKESAAQNSAVCGRAASTRGVGVVLLAGWRGAAARAVPDIVPTLGAPRPALSPSRARRHREPIPCRADTRRTIAAAPATAPSAYPLRTSRVTSRASSVAG